MKTKTSNGDSETGQCAFQPVKICQENHYLLKFRDLSTEEDHAKY